MVTSGAGLNIYLKASKLHLVKQVVKYPLFWIDTFTSYPVESHKPLMYLLIICNIMFVGNAIPNIHKSTVLLTLYYQITIFL